MAEQVWFKGENGMLNVSDVPLPDGIAHRLERGDLVRVNPDGSPWTEPEPEPEAEDAPLPDGAPPLPKRTAQRQVWVDFAISQGMDRDEAARASKADLVEKFTRAGS